VCILLVLTAQLYHNDGSENLKIISRLVPVKNNKIWPIATSILNPM